MPKAAAGYFGAVLAVGLVQLGGFGVALANARCADTAQVVVLFQLAATGLGARLPGVAKVSRPNVIRAHVVLAGGAAAKAGTNHKPKPGKLIYGSATISVPPGGQTVTLGCPPNVGARHVINGTLGALHGTQAQYFTIHGFGLLSQKKWFIDLDNSNPDNPIKGIGFIICET